MPPEEGFPYRYSGVLVSEKADLHGRLERRRERQNYPFAMSSNRFTAGLGSVISLAERMVTVGMAP